MAFDWQAGRGKTGPYSVQDMGDVRTRARELAARYRAEAAQVRAHSLHSISRADLRTTFLHTAETCEALAREVERVGEAEAPDEPMT